MSYAKGNSIDKLIGRTRLILFYGVGRRVACPFRQRNNPNYPEDRRGYNVISLVYANCVRTVKDSLVITAIV